MDKNNQNKSSKGEYLQILLEPTGTLSHSTVLTLNEDKLKELGIFNHHVVGVTWTSEGYPISYGILTGDETSFMINQIKTILSASIVNAEQRKAVEYLIDKVIRGRQFEMANFTYRKTTEVVQDSESASNSNGLEIATKPY